MSHYEKERRGVTGVSHGVCHCGIALLCCVVEYRGTMNRPSGTSSKFAPFLLWSSVSTMCITKAIHVRLNAAAKSVLVYN